MLSGFFGILIFAIIARMLCGNHLNMNLHNKSRKVSMKTRLTPASVSFEGDSTEPTTVKIVY